MKPRMIIIPIGMEREIKMNAYKRELKYTFRSMPDVKGIQRLLSSPTLQLLINTAGTIRAYIAMMKSQMGKESPAPLVEMLMIRTTI